MAFCERWKRQIKVATTLEKLKDRDQAVVLKLQGGRGFRQRLFHCGVHTGDRVQVIRTG
jgi:Fe2+ transport system protein FeoA